MDEIRRANKRLKTVHETFSSEYQQFLDNLEREELRIEKRYETYEEKKRSIAKAHGNPTATEDDLVEINAGGKVIAAKRSTLTHMQGTLFSGCWDKRLQKDDDGRIFLDVNSEAFQSIVDYLHEVAISSPGHLPPFPTVDKENQCLMEQMLKIFALKSTLIDSNVVKTDAHAALLHDWLEEEEEDGDFDLLYRSTRDGRSPSDFHSRCDDVPCTLTVIETTDGFILGVYSKGPWKSDGNNSAYDQSLAEKAFLFALAWRDPYGIPILSPCKIKLSSEILLDSISTDHNPESGPSFDGGLKLKVVGSKLVLMPLSDEMEPLGDFQSQEHTINEVEVFRVNKIARNEEHAQVIILVKIQKASSFTNDINNALNVKIQTIEAAEQKICDLENRLDAEEKFIDLYASGEAKDVVMLNVSGTVMATKRSTLMVFEESALARQFDDSKWTEQGYVSQRVKEWTPDDVFFWAQSIEDVSDEIATIFVQNQITGNELLALEMEGLKMIGIKRAGTLCLLLKEIKKLEKLWQSRTFTLIEHSPYCFGKILDYLRLKQLHSQNLAVEPDLPVVDESERRRFEKVVKYFFPGESAELILGREMPITIKMAINAIFDPVRSGNLLLKDGRPLYVFTLVAAVRTHESQPEEAIYIEVEDGTGCMQVELPLNEEDGISNDQTICQDGTYIRIIGQVKVFRGERRILARNVRPLRSGNELTEHFLEVVSYYEKHLKSQQRDAAKELPDALLNVPASPQAVAAARYAGSLLNGSVLRCIIEMGAPEGDSGVHVDQIRDHLSPLGFSANDVRNAIRDLSNEGQIYSTIDEFHYQFAP